MLWEKSIPSCFVSDSGDSPGNRSTDKRSLTVTAITNAPSNFPNTITITQDENVSIISLIIIIIT